MRINPSPWQSWALSCLLAMLPLAFSAVLPGKVLLIAVAVICGLAVIARYAEARRCFGHAQAIVAVCLLSLGYAILNVIGHRLSWNELDLSSHILLFLAIAALFTLRLRMPVIWLGFSLSAAVLGVVCLVQRYHLGIDRAYGLNGGSWAAIEFAMFMLVLVLMALIQLLNPKIGRPAKLVHGIGAVLGMYGALLTQSRGPLMAFAPVFLLVVLLHMRRTRTWRFGILLIAGAMLGGALVSVSLHREIMTRFAEVPHEMETYSKNETGGAVRERLEMWRTAMMAFQSHPWTGLGIDQFGVYARKEIVRGQSSTSIMQYDHPHSEYLEAAATGGVPGLVVLLLLFGVPLVHFWKRARHALDEIAIPAIAGLAVVSMYALCSLGDNVFYRAMPHSLFFFLVLGMALRIAKAERDEA